MLALLLASQIAVGGGMAPPRTPADIPSAHSPRVLMERVPRQPVACSSATRVEAVEPGGRGLPKAGDRAARPRRLGDLPPASPCLVGAPPEATK